MVKGKPSKPAFTISCWGRMYQLGTLGLPEQIVASQVQMLAAPIEIRGCEPLHHRDAVVAQTHELHEEALRDAVAVAAPTTASVDRPMARFMRKLDETLLKESEEVYIVAVWLTDDVDKTKGYLPRAQQSLKFQNTA